MYVCTAIDTQVWAWNLFSPHSVIFILFFSLFLGFRYNSVLSTDGTEGHFFLSTHCFRCCVNDTCLDTDATFSHDPSIIFWSFTCRRALPWLVKLIGHPVKHCVVQWWQDGSNIHSITLYLRLPHWRFHDFYQQKNRSLISYIQISSVVVLGKATVKEEKSTCANNHILCFISNTYFLSYHHIHFTKVTYFSGKISRWYHQCIHCTCSFNWGVEGRRVAWTLLTEKSTISQSYLQTHWTCTIIFPGRYIWSLEVILPTHVLCKDVWERFQSLPLRFLE